MSLLERKSQHTKLNVVYSMYLAPIVFFLAVVFFVLPSTGLKYSHLFTVKKGSEAVSWATCISLPFFVFSVTFLFTAMILTFTIKKIGVLGKILNILFGLNIVVIIAIIFTMYYFPEKIKLGISYIILFCHMVVTVILSVTGLIINFLQREVKR